MSMNWWEIQDGLQKWVAKELPFATVIWENQNAPQPKIPYVILNIDSIRTVEHNFEDMPDSSGKRTIYGTKDFTLSINVYGTWSATATLDDLILTLEQRDIQAELRIHNIIVREINEIQGLTFLEDSRFIERAQTDVIFRTSVAIPYGGDSELTSIIEHVTINGDYNVGNTTQVEQTITVPVT